MERRRVVILFGGTSSEREVSRISARTIASGLDPAKYEILPVAMAMDGRFMSQDDSRRLLAGELPSRFAPAPDSGVPWEEAVPPQSHVETIVFPIIHGTGGEDGALQGFLDTLDVAYVGAGVTASAVGMDKAVFKSVMRDEGIPTLAAKVVRTSSWSRSRMGSLRSILSELPLPLFVKPANGGSSIGITKVTNPDGLAPAIDEAFRYDDKVLVECGVDAREIECSVLGNEMARASCLGEIVPGGEFYDYEDKYISGEAGLLVPADLPQTLTDEIKSLAVKIFEVSGCDGMARVDFLVENGTGRVYINEINTLPGFTAISMYPRLWAATGLSMGSLLDELIELARARFARRKELAVTRTPPQQLHCTESAVREQATAA